MRIAKEQVVVALDQPRLSLDSRTYARAPPRSARSPAYIIEFLTNLDGLRLAKAFMRIPQSALQRRIVDLVDEIAGEDRLD